MNEVPKQDIKKPLLAATFIVVIVASFFGGMQYQKSRGEKTNQAKNSQGLDQQNGNFPGRFNGQRQRPTVGTVASVADKTIKISLENNGGDKTIAVTDNTKITNNNSSATLSDIKTGDTLMVMGKTNDDGTVTAEMIRINPSFNESSNNNS
jgi:hypothetical protein